MAKTVLIRCPKCGMELEAPARLVGKAATCPDCDSQFLVSHNTVDKRSNRAAASATRGSKGTTAGNVAKLRTPSSHATNKVPPTPEDSALPTSPAFDSSADRDLVTPEKSVVAATPTDPFHPSERNFDRDRAESNEKQKSIDHGAGKKTAVFKGLADPAADTTLERAVAESPLSSQPSSSAMPPQLNQPKDDESVRSAEAGSTVSGSEASDPVDEVASSASAETGEKAGGKSAKKTKDRRKIRRAKEKRKTQSAKLVSEGANASRIQLGEDGSLPQLVVNEVDTKTKTSQSTQSTNPVLLVAVLAASVLISTVVLFMPSGGTVDSKKSVETSLEHLRENYFGEPPLDSYELLLREAVQHENRGERRQAKRNYRRVLNLLHQEGVKPHIGVSGPRNASAVPNDNDLEEHLQFLISARN